MRLYRMLETIDSCPAPVVCCVHGFALGGGSGLVACADVAIAWPDAVFGFTEVRLGIIPAVISPFVLAQGRQRRTSLLRDRRAVRRPTSRCGSASSPRCRRTRRATPSRSWRTSSRAARSPCARRSGSCASVRPGSTRRTSRRRGGRATRDRTACARSSTDERPTGSTTRASRVARRGTSSARGTGG